MALITSDCAPCKTAFTIGANEPWGIPTNETFWSELLVKAGYD